MIITVFIELNLDYISDNPWLVMSCSALQNTNVDEVLKWLIKQSKTKS